MPVDGLVDFLINAAVNLEGEDVLAPDKGWPSLLNEAAVGSARKRRKQNSVNHKEL